jgi:hypothetical protein
MVYMLSFNGQFRSIDEFAMYARTESLAQGNGLNTPQLAFSSWHHPVGALEPGQPLLAVPLYLIARQMEGVSNIAAVMLFNTFVSALTGVALYVLLRQLSFSQRGAVVTALAWGIGTTAWPYARSFFREPLLSLIWLSATSACITWQQTRRFRYAAACIALLCTGLAVKISSVAAIPVFALALLWDPHARRLRLGQREGAFIGVVAVLSLAAGYQLYGLRYGQPFPIAQYTWQYPWRDAMLRAYGQFLSPVKGLIFYSPIILATLTGWPRLVRRHGTIAIVTAGVALSLVYTYGRIPFWHGGSVVWGPRFVVPLLPLLMVPYAAALAGRRLWARAWVGLWSVVGLVVQAAVGTASWSDAVQQMIPAYEGEALVGLGGIPWYSWALAARSPALVQLAHWQPRQLDLIWLRMLAHGALTCDGPLAALLLTLTGLALAALTLLLSRALWVRRREALVVALCPLIVLAGSTGLLLRSGRSSNDHWGLTRAEARQLASAASPPDRSPYSVVLVSNDFFVNYWLGLLKGHFVTQWYSPYDARGLAGSVAQAPKAETLWLVVDHVHMPTDAEPHLARHILAQQAYEVGGRWVGGYEMLELVPPRPMIREVTRRSWENGIEILAISTNTRQIRPGDALRLDLEFVAREPLAQDCTLFVHLVPSTGAVIPGRDGEPQYGAAPTSGWQPGQTVLDRRGLRVPVDAPPGVYRLAIGWLCPDGLVVAPVAGEEPTVDGKIVLGTIEVLAD